MPTWLMVRNKMDALASAVCGRKAARGIEHGGLGQARANNAIPHCRER